MPSTSSNCPQAINISRFSTGTKWATTTSPSASLRKPHFMAPVTETASRITTLKSLNLRNTRRPINSCFLFCRRKRRVFRSPRDLLTTRGSTLRGNRKINTAWGYYPSTSATGGDTWFNNSRNYYDNPVKGNYGYFTIIHKPATLLGLKHAHESMNSLVRCQLIVTLLSTR